MPSLFILLPLIGIIILNLPSRRLMKKIAFWFAAGLFLVQIALAIFHHPGFLANELERFDSFFKTSFAMDHLSFLMLLTIGIVSLASLLVGRAMLHNDQERFNFINLLIIASIGMCGIVMVTDIFSLYVFLEITAVSGFMMIAFRKGLHALEGAFKYVILSAVATILMLTSIGLLLLICGDTSFAGIQDALRTTGHNDTVMLAIGLFICGLMIKGGIVPFHGWLPDAYSEAPSPSSILLAGIVTKVSGIYTLIRVVTLLFGFEGPIGRILMFVGILSIVIGALAALGQTNFKRMLAYSSISQVGYIIVGLGTGSVLGIAGAVFHLFNHAIFKSLLFVNAAAVEEQTGTVDMNKLGGLSTVMPVTGTTSVIAFLSTSGVPPLSGFWSKVIIILALWQSSHYAYAAIAVLASLLTLAYLLTMQRQVFFGKIAAGLERTKEVRGGFLLVSIVLALITIGVGIFFPMVLSNFIMPAHDILVQR